uniref:Uncharacterized protein n=1 Tax=Knipowitschia caucasica TaxID=637954 RepID=A0AAV2LA35_KNICA
MDEYAERSSKRPCRSSPSASSTPPSPSPSSRPPSSPCSLPLGSLLSPGWRWWWVEVVVEVVVVEVVVVGAMDIEGRAVLKATQGEEKVLDREQREVQQDL